MRWCDRWIEVTAWGDEIDDGIRDDEIDNGIRDDEIDEGMQGDDLTSNNLWNLAS